MLQKPLVAVCYLYKHWESKLSFGKSQTVHFPWHIQSHITKTQMQNHSLRSFLYYRKKNLLNSLFVFIYAQANSLKYFLNRSILNSALQNSALQGFFPLFLFPIYFTLTHNATYTFLQKKIQFVLCRIDSISNSCHCKYVVILLPSFKSWTTVTVWQDTTKGTPYFLKYSALQLFFLFILHWYL